VKNISLFIVFLFAATGCLMTACNREEETPDETPVKGILQVNVKTSFNGLPFDLNQPYTNIQNYRVKMQSLAFLMHNFYAKTADGNYCLVKEALRYDRSQNAVSSFTFAIDPGTYQGISFSIGIDSALNHSDPALLAASHPFSYNVSADLHWGWNTGYIFLKMEGDADTSGTGSGAFDRTFLYHIGVDELFRRFDFYSNSFSITADQTTTLNIELDVAKMFYNGIDTIDLKTEYATQSSGSMPLARQFVSVYEDAFSVY